MPDFFQDRPELLPTFQSDSRLQSYLKSKWPVSMQREIWPHFESLGKKAVGSWLAWSRQAEGNPPIHVAYDSFGHRVDEIRTSQGWRELHDEAAREGIVATAYERKYGEWSRVYQSVLLYLFHPSSAFVSCPMAMTDGAARALELYGSKEMKARAFQHLTSRDPNQFWTSGQWMTEKSGGSDVSNTETVAKKMPGSQGWQLYGTKWFTSAVDADMALLLARPEGAEPGNKGLSLFYCELRDAQEQLQNIEILRLKDKLGTRALPTAELRLEGTPAQLVGDEGHGVRKIAALFNTTRVYNSVCATSHARRALDWAKAYAGQRRAFGKLMKDHALHRALEIELEADFKKCFDLTFFVSELLGREECGVASDEEKLLLRALTPLAKLFTAKKSMAITSEVVEIFAGVGYCEDSGIPTLLRDAQVFSIWEGTTSVLSLDFLRALFKDGALEPLLAFLKKTDVDKTKMRLVNEILMHSKSDRENKLEAKARELAFLCSELICQALA